MFLISDKGITYFGRETNLILLWFKLPITAETTSYLVLKFEISTVSIVFSRYGLFLAFFKVKITHSCCFLSRHSFVELASQTCFCA